MQESIVETSYGKVRGQTAHDVTVFRAIPYARPPVGSRRFFPPARPEAWPGVRDATKVGRAAPQNPSPLMAMLGSHVRVLDEDCLTLDVATPAPDGGKRPVMVWIHGGAFILGAGSDPMYDGGTLARVGDVVVVTINYRLGALGFLDLAAATENRVPAPGNQGLRDQIAALEWVRDEIAAFGGDPDNVTVFGESAGAISVGTLLGAPAARGLFRRAILQSGAPNFVNPRDVSERVAREVLTELGIPRTEAARILDVPVERLLGVQLRIANRGGVGGLPFAPSIDGITLPQHPFHTIAAGGVRDVGVLVGTTLEEMKLFMMMDPKAKTLDDAGLLRRCARMVPGTDPERAARVVETYRDARAARGMPVTPPELWCAIDSDKQFRYPSTRVAELQRAHGADAFSYLFTWRSPLMEGALGACHALELPFVWGTLVHPALALFAGSGETATRLAHRMQEAWVAFARTGNPSTHALPWPGYDVPRRATMIFGPESGVEDSPLEPERRFWEFWDGIL